MAEQDQDATKEFEPSQKKLDDLRKKGEVPKSNDLTAAASIIGLVGIWTVLGPDHILGMGQQLSYFLAPSSGHVSGQDTPNLRAEVALRVLGLVLLVLPWFLAPSALTLLSLFGQKSIVFAPSKLAPKLSRISPLSNARNKFGRQGLFEFLKSLTKLTLVSVALVIFIAQNLDDVATTLALNPAQSITLMVGLAVQFLWIVLLFYLVIGGVDLLWQQVEHLRKNRMSRQEMTDEHKQSEGDPHVKQQRRQRAQEIATNRMLADVPNADVVIVNPTHYAVALRWDRSKGTAPVCVAKGVDEIAHRIRHLAASSAVPVYSDPPSARAIHAVVEVGSEILPDHYRAVAAAIRFADKLYPRARTAWNKN